MIIGIVGSEGAKFTTNSKMKAFGQIAHILCRDSVTKVVSGGCHLGGIDAWAVDVGKDLGLEITEFLPKQKSWEGGYKDRNLLIAEASDEVHCITIDRLPENYTGMRFPLCYHCGVDTHVKSGGCWTVKQAIRLGKPGYIHVIET